MSKRKGQRRKRLSRLGPLSPTTAMLPRELRETLEALADELGYTLSRTIVEWMMEHITQPKRTRGK